jgi:UDP-N-acetylmuramoyl-L-alanyl-D-glutamate--2,6-diaminopimelate ligase
MTAAQLALTILVRRLAERSLLITQPASDILFTGVADDSRSVQPGDLFCAWSGSSTDAHGFVGAAAAAGAAAAIVERPVADVQIPQIVVRDGRRAAALAASLFHGEPERALRIIGVTGTNGKTTSVWMLRHMLSHRAPAASLGTLGTILDDGSTLPGSEALTTPGPVDLARTLRLLVDRGVRFIAMEVSSHALHQGRVQALRFDAAVFTNLSRDHLDYHGTFEAYLQAKRSFVTLLTPTGSAVINADDDAWRGLAAEAPAALTFGVEHDADVRARRIELDASGARFELVVNDDTTPATVPLPGSFNVHNALGAAAACAALGFGIHETAAALASIPQVPGRLERIAARPCSVLRDYAHTPDALERVLLTLRELTTGRVIVVFGAGGDRDRGKRPLMGSVAQQHADLAIVTSDNPRTEDPDAIIDEIEAGMSGAHVRITDRRAAIAHALTAARADDVIVLAGKGHETYQIVGTEKTSFDEREIVAELIGAAA